MENGYWLLALIPGLPLVGAAVTAAARNRWGKPALAGTASTMVGLAFLVTVAALVRYLDLGGGALELSLWSWGPAGVGLGLLGDAVSLWFLLVVTGVGLLIHIYASAYMADDPGYGRFFAELNYFIFAMSLLVLADGFLGMLIGWANVGLASYLLIGFWNQRDAAAAASRKAFWVNTAGEVGLILAMAIIWNAFGSLRFADVLPQAGQADPEVLNAIALLLLVGAVAKSAQLPLHVWLPDAMQGPTPVSALIHAATMVTAGVYLAVRAFPLFEAAPVGMTAVAVVGVASALFGAVVAVGQNDIKRVLAFSTMSQVGYMILGAGVGAYSAALFHFMTHAFFKALLFLGAGIVIHHFHGEQDIRRMGGLGRQLPFAYWTFLIGTLALIGVPPLSGFFSKDEIVVALLETGHPWLWALAVAAAGLTAFYMTRLFCLVFTGPAPNAGARGRAAKEAAAARETEAVAYWNPAPGVHPLKAVPVLLLTVLSAVAGLLSVPGLTAVPEEFLGRVLGHYGAVPAAAAAVAPEQAKTLTIAVLLGVAAVAMLLGVRLYGPSRRAAGRPMPLEAALAHGFYFDDLYRAVFVRPLRGLAAYVGQVIDPQVVDGAVNGIARLAGTLAVGLRHLHGGYVRRYALALMAGTAVIVLYFVLL
ncbi:MAG TPA: NADH-quinone oxidoreductase subunit L [Limnochordales bacterium]|nr:NADH-quinone oxidoreductase subunit L [Limnochordales bacterium]